MKTPSFLNAVSIGLAISLVGALFFITAMLLMPVALSVYLSISVVAASYSIFLCISGKSKSGWLTFNIAIAFTTAAAWGFSLSILSFLALTLLLIWLLRSSRFYKRISSILLDLILLAAGFLSAIATYTHTQSFFIGLWVFFLTQALFVFIPHTHTAQNSQTMLRQNAFDTALKNAESALTKINQVY